jgi:hypothetical protein
VGLDGILSENYQEKWDLLVMGSNIFRVLRMTLKKPVEILFPITHFMKLSFFNDFSEHSDQ